MSWVTGFGTFLGAAITIVVSVAVYLHGTRKDKYQVDIALVSELRKKNQIGILSNDCFLNYIAVAM